MYVETENDKYASVVVVVRSNSSIERFEHLRGARACLMEFGSIGRCLSNNNRTMKSIFL